MITPIHSLDPRVTEWLKACGITDLNNTQRVIIDIPVDDVVRIYTTHVADAKMFDVRFEDGCFDVVTVDKADGECVVETTSRDAELDGFRSYALKDSGA